MECKCNFCEGLKKSEGDAAFNFWEVSCAVLTALIIIFCLLA